MVLVLICHGFAMVAVWFCGGLLWLWCFLAFSIALLLFCYAFAMVLLRCCCGVAVVCLWFCDGCVMALLPALVLMWLWQGCGVVLSFRARQFGYGFGEVLL